MKADNGHRSKSASLALLFLGLAAVALTGFVALLWMGTGDAGAENKQTVAEGIPARVTPAALVEPERQALARGRANRAPDIKEEPHPAIVSEPASPDSLTQSEAMARAPQTAEVDTKQESPDETVRKLIEDPLGGFYHPSRGSHQRTQGRGKLKALLEGLEREARIQAVQAYIETASLEQQQDLLAEVIAMCRHYIDNLPAYIPNGEPWQPNMAAPGGALAYPGLLAALDSDGSSLPLLVEMAEAEQEAQQACSVALLGAPLDQHIFSDMNILIGHACGEILDRYNVDPALHEGVTEEQAAVLEEFRAYQQRPRNPETAHHDSAQLVEFARQFVSAQSSASSAS